jgi:hypothetical protein
MADAPVAAPAAEAKPMTFGQLTESNVPVTEDKAKKASPDMESESDSEDDSGLVETDQDFGSEREEDADALEDEAEEAEEGAEDADEELEGDTPDNEQTEEEYLEMARGNVGKILQEMPQKELEKALSSVALEVKVDGKMEKVALKDLKESYSSRTHNTRWAQENKQKEIAVTQRMQEVEQTIGPVWTALKADKLEQSFLSLAEIGGKNILEVKRQLRAELAPVILGLARMSPEQQKQFMLQEENEFYKSQQETAKKRATEETTKSQSSEAVRRAQVEHGIPDSEMEFAVDWLLQNKFNGDKSKLTIDGVIEAVFVSRAIDRAVEAVSIAKPSLKDDNEFLDRVVRLAKGNPKAPISKLAKWVREHAPSSKDKDAGELAKDISRKVLRTKPKSSLEKPHKQKAQSFGDLL